MSSRSMEQPAVVSAIRATMKNPLQPGGLAFECLTGGAGLHAAARGASVPAGPIAGVVVSSFPIRIWPRAYAQTPSIESHRMTDETITARIQTDMVAAMKSKDVDTLSTLRMLKTALMEAKTKKPKDAVLSADEEIEVLQRYVKKRRETIAEFLKHGREDVVVKEEAEIAVTMRFLPQPVSEDDLRAIVREAVASTGATTGKDMGKVIAAVMAQVKGRAEGAMVSRLVKELLTD